MRAAAPFRPMVCLCRLRRYKRFSEVPVMVSCVTHAFALAAIVAAAVAQHVVPAVDQMCATIDSQHATYRLSVKLQGNAQSLVGIYGTASSPMRVPAAVHTPNSRLDSWLTIGLPDGDTNHDLGFVNYDEKLWTAAAGINDQNVSIFWVNASESTATTDRMPIAVAQLTVPMGFVGIASMGMRGKTVGNLDWSDDNIMFNITGGKVTPCGTPCSAGRYQEMTSQNGCQPCPAGSVTDTLSGVGATSCTSCRAGQFSPQATTQCAACRAGTTTPPAGVPNAQCVPCAAGKFSTMAGASACTSCPRGTYAPTGSSSCTQCTPGTYDDDGVVAATFGLTSAATACVGCPPGFSQSKSGQFTCQRCPPGSITDTLQKPGAKVCRACVAGQSSHVATEPCATCSAGRYQPASGQHQCLACAPGQILFGNSCTNCTAGKYQPKAGQTACLACSTAGYVTNTLSLGGATSCSKCPAGRFFTSATVACSKCGAGRYQPASGKSTCIACGPGTQPSTDSTFGFCTVCDVGRYSAIANAQCSACAIGKYQPQSGQSSCLPCGPGTEPASNSKIGSCTICGVGQFSAKPTDPCRACPVGQYQPQPGQGKCTACASGQYQPLPGHTACLPCGPGTQPASNSAAGDCTACAVGTFSNASHGLCSSCAVGSATDNPPWSYMLEISEDLSINGDNNSRAAIADRWNKLVAGTSQRMRFKGSKTAPKGVFAKLSASTVTFHTHAPFDQLAANDVCDCRNGIRSCNFNGASRCSINDREHTLIVDLQSKSAGTIALVPRGFKGNNLCRHTLSCWTGENPAAGSAGTGSSTKALINKAWLPEAPDAKVTSRGQGEKICIAAGFDRLCTYQEYCPDGPSSFPAGGPQGDDEWAPIYEGDNSWVQVGKSGGRHDACRMHESIHGGQPPSWGLTASAPPQVGNLLCCNGTVPPVKSKWYEFPSMQTSTQAKSECGYLGMSLCPNSVVCPNGPGKSPSGGRRANHEEWTPTREDQWVQIGMHKSSKPCQTHSKSIGSKASWGAAASQTGWIMCCPNSMWLPHRPIRNRNHAASECLKAGFDRLGTYAEYCPDGPGKPPVGGLKSGDKWSPTFTGSNNWVNVGLPTGGAGRASDACRLFQSLHTGNAPQWGLSASAPSVTGHVLCSNGRLPKLKPSWFELASPKTGTEAKAECTMRGMNLCPVSIVCPSGSGKPPRGGPQANNAEWTPAQGSRWVNVGVDNSTKLCDDRPQSSWGLTTVVRTSRVLCCGPPALPSGAVAAVAKMSSKDMASKMMKWHFAAGTSNSGLIDGLYKPLGSSVKNSIVAVQLSGKCTSSSLRVFGTDQLITSTDLRHVRVAYSLDGHSWTCHTQSSTATQGSTPSLATASASCTRGSSHLPSGAVFQIPKPARFVQFAFWGQSVIQEIELMSCSGFTLHLPAVKCSFELAGICGWTEGGSQHWVQGSSTPSAYTGPGRAHSGSLFMYLESDLGSIGAVSYLYSPTLKGMRSINFWYHMYGNARTAGNNYMGTLAVEAHTSGTTWVSVWSKSGAQNYGYTDDWIQAAAALPSNGGGSKQIRFKATRGHSAYSDMAIDDVTMSGDALKPIPTVCSFEMSNAGGTGCSGWTRSGYWYQNSKTPTSSTGAAKAQAGTYFMYLESNNGQAGYASYVVSPQLKKIKYIQFWYRAPPCTMSNTNQ